MCLLQGQLIAVQTSTGIVSDCIASSATFYEQVHYSLRYFYTIPVESRCPGTSHTVDALLIACQVTMDCFSPFQ